eukprot:m.153816 g.153816  ORF g.153816 m.153816 type:complete len:62 (+) comp17481_c1_seq2:138-323(+)
MQGVAVVLEPRHCNCGGVTAWSSWTQHQHPSSGQQLKLTAPVHLTVLSLAATRTLAPSCST